MSRRLAVRPTGLWLGLAAALAVAGFLTPFASRRPDGLDRVAQDHGLTARTRTSAGALMPDYRVAGVGHPALSTSLAGIAGTLLTFGAGWGLSLLLPRHKSAERRPERQSVEPR